MLRDEMEWVQEVVAIAVGEFEDKIKSLKNDIRKLESAIKSLSNKPEPKPEPAPAKYKADTSK